MKAEIRKFVARNHAIPLAAIDKYCESQQGYSGDPNALTVKGQDIYLDGVIVDSATDTMYKAWGLDMNFVTPENVRNALDGCAGQDVTLWINSPGGSVFDASAILTAMQRHQEGNRVNVVVDGVAASAATYLAVHGDSRQIGKMAMFMIHNSWTCACGDADEMFKVSELLGKIDDTYAEMMAEKSGMKQADILESMSAETWYTGKEAVDAGFMDSVYEPKKNNGKSKMTAAERALHLAQALQYH